MSSSAAVSPAPDKLAPCHRSVWATRPSLSVQLLLAPRVHRLGSFANSILPASIINTSYQKLPFGSGDYPDKLPASKFQNARAVVPMNPQLWYNHRLNVHFHTETELRIIGLSRAIAYSHGSPG